MPKYYELDGKRYKSADGSNLGKLDKYMKIEYVNKKILVPVRYSNTKSLGSRTGIRRRKCSEWGEVGNRSTWSEAMKAAGGNSRDASAIYRSNYVPASSVSGTERPGLRYKHPVREKGVVKSSRRAL